MNDTEVRGLAVKHWVFLKPFIQLICKYASPEELVDIIGYLYVESGTHFAKHERESRNDQKYPIKHQKIARTKK